mmetsp:Transcript_28043/g.72513  ORF Transcript_28043/g.72513 Transcript_28043/m.72513 type:complete len:215 (-) Transcript_28043:160-804(-)
MRMGPMARTQVPGCIPTNALNSGLDRSIPEFSALVGMQPGTWVRAIGPIRIYGEQWHVAGYFVGRIKGDELPYHMVSVCFSSAHLQGLVKTAKQAAPQGQQQSLNAPSQFQPSFGGAPVGGFGVPQQQLQQGMSMGGLPVAQQLAPGPGWQGLIQTSLKQAAETQNTGFSADVGVDLCRQQNVHVDRQQVQMYLSHLEEQGLAYSDNQGVFKWA